LSNMKGFTVSAGFKTIAFWITLAYILIVPLQIYPETLPVTIGLYLKDNAGDNISLARGVTISYEFEDARGHPSAKSINTRDNVGAEILHWNTYLGKSFLYFKIQAVSGTKITIGISGYNELVLPAKSAGINPDNAPVYFLSRKNQISGKPRGREKRPAVIPKSLLDKAAKNPDAMQRVIIRFSKKPQNRRSFVEAEGGKVLYDYDIIQGIAVSVAARKIGKLKEMKNVISVEEDEICHAVLDDSVPLINADDVQNGSAYSGVGYDGSGVTVCVVDTGIDKTYPAFAGRIIGEYDFVNGDNDATDDDGHGTHVAGIIASADATYRGVAPGAFLTVAKVLDATGTGYSSDIIAGIEWGVANGADVINMSIGGSKYTSYCDDNPTAAAVNSAVDAGCVVVIASGNEGYTDGIDFPACASKAISVGDVYDADVGSVSWVASCTDPATYADMIVCHANRSEILDVLAPGAMIKSTQMGGGFVNMGGTSMAAPHVAGLAALMLEEDSALTPQQIEDILKYTGVPIEDAGGSGLIFPRVDALAAVDIGRLEPYSVTESMEVTQNHFFDFTAGVMSVKGDSGNVSARLQTFVDSQPTTCSEIWGGDCSEGPPESFDTTFDDCSPGAGGDESVQEVHLNRNQVGFGEEITVTCDVETKSVSCGGAYTDDNLRMYYRNNPAGTWRKIYQVDQVYSCESYSATFVPDEIEGEHQVRCIVGWNVPEGECGSGDWYDNDDVNFTVVNNVISTTEGAEPFYTTSDNPQIFPDVLLDETREPSWQLKATGEPGTYQLSARFSSDTPIPSAESPTVAITVVSAIFSQPCSAGYNLISLPFDGTTITDAESLAQAVPNSTAVWKWDAVAQAWSGHPLGGPNNFAVVPGGAYLVSVSASGTFECSGSWATPTFALKTGYNLISLPKSKEALTTAEALAGDIPNCTAIWKWDAGSQTWTGHPLGGPNNFAVQVGGAYLISVTADGTW